MRPTLSIFALDRPALVDFSKELKTFLLTDDRGGLATTLGLGSSLAERLKEGARAVDWLLRPEDHPEAAPLFASLRRIAKKRALALTWTSPEPSLEGRLRHFDVLREDAEIAGLIDKLLDPARLPWFLCRPGATAGWLDGQKRERLAGEMRKLRPALPKEIAEFSDAIGDIEGDIVVHDGL